MLSSGALQTCGSCHHPIGTWWPGSGLGFLGPWHRLDFTEWIHRVLLAEEDFRRRNDSGSWNLASHGQKARGSEADSSVSPGVQSFSPAQLSVKLVGRKVVVSGKREERRDEGEDGCHHSYRRDEFEREYLLPEGVDAQALTCSLSDEGVLHIEAPSRPPAAGRERIVPITLLTPRPATPPQPGPGTPQSTQQEGERKKA